MLLDYFIDPVLRGPTLGSIFMGAAAALIGTLTLLQKKSLVTETVSHAAYPGTLLALFIGGKVFQVLETETLFFSIFILTGAFFTAALSLFSLNYLIQTLKFPSDFALCLIIALFFGAGVTLSSLLQFQLTTLFRTAQNYLFGQSATMNDTHIFIFGFFLMSVIAFITAFQRNLQIFLFDPTLAKLLGFSLSKLHFASNFFLLLTIILGIRTAGVILMSALLIIPPIAARQCTNHLSSMFIVSALIGAFCSFMGNVLSFEFHTPSFFLPTGPLIVLTASFFAFFTLLTRPNQWRRQNRGKTP